MMAKPIKTLELHYPMMIHPVSNNVNFEKKKTESLDPAIPEFLLA